MKVRLVKTKEKEKVKTALNTYPLPLLKQLSNFKTGNWTPRSIEVTPSKLDKARPSNRLEGQVAVGVLLLLLQLKPRFHCLLVGLLQLSGAAQALKQRGATAATALGRLQALPGSR